MRPLWHVMAGVGLGAIVFRATASWQLAACSATTEIFVDLDHAIEHLFQSRHPFCIRTFLSKRNSLDWSKMVFIFHSYEWIIFLIVLGWYFNLPFLWAIALGLIIHIFLDEIGNRRYILPGRLSLGFYFFSYRLFKHFRTKSLVYENSQKKLQKEI